jgi:hypothetical protein
MHLAIVGRKNHGGLWRVHGGFMEGLGAYRGLQALWGLLWCSINKHDFAAGL